MAVTDVALGIFFGLSLAAPPGPVNALMALEAAGRGNRRGTLVGAGALTADAVFFALTALLGSRLEPGRAGRVALYVLGAVVLAIFAYLALRSGRSLPTPAAGTQGTSPDPRPYVKGLTMGLTNPFQIIWWLTVGLSIIVLFGLSFVGGLFLGILAWIFLFPWGIAAAQRRFRSLYRWIVYASAAIILAFAGWSLFEAATLVVS